MNKKIAHAGLPTEHLSKLLMVLQARFNANTHRHEGMQWGDVQIKLESHREKLWSLEAMERTGGEPDVVAYDDDKGEYIFFDCSAESPAGRRNVCFDHKGQDSRKHYVPEDNACDMAAAMGIELLTETHYRELQQLGDFDSKTSSWLMTPHDIRRLGGALFGDRRYGHVFIYHNGAHAYFGSRGFRGLLRV